VELFLKIMNFKTKQFQANLSIGYIFKEFVLVRDLTKWVSERGMAKTISHP